MPERLANEREALKEEVNCALDFYGGCIFLKKSKISGKIYNVTKEVTEI